VVVLDLVEVAEDEVAAVRGDVEVVAALHFDFEQARRCGRNHAFGGQALCGHALGDLGGDIVLVGRGGKGRDAETTDSQA